MLATKYVASASEPSKRLHSNFSTLSYSQCQILQTKRSTRTTNFSQLMSTHTTREQGHTYSTVKTRPNSVHFVNKRALKQAGKRKDRLRFL